MADSPTLKDVAAAAGVSTATVARVLHGQGYVAEGTRQRVEQALAQSGYRLNVLAQSLRQRRTRILGHILHAISPNPFYAQVALGSEQEALRRGYSVISINVQGDAGREQAAVETFIRRQVDAILFTTPIAAANVQLALDAGVKVVQVERPTPVATARVLVDNYAGSAAAVEHLIGLGHRRIAFIGAGYDPAAHSAAHLIEEQRLSGYCDALHGHGLAVDERWIGLGEYYSLEGEGGGVPGDGHRFAARFLAGEPRPTAIFAACDLLAAGALQAIYEAGLRVPHDISLVGFDNTIGPFLTPPLTTVAQPMIEIGRAAARLAIEQLEGGLDGEADNGVGDGPHGGAGGSGADGAVHAEHPVERLAVRLVLRSSTGPAP